jgi:glycerophosphoryl diester phosphodiesterase
MGADLTWWQITLITIGAVVVSYALTSAVCLRAPPLPWTRRKSRWAFTARRIAHRGGSLLGPENTMYTFRKALKECDVDMLEIDVCLTADGVVVVAHDELTDRVCGVPLAIGETKFADLPLLARKIPLHFHGPQQLDTYVMPDAEWAEVGAQPFCSLREVFEAFPNVPIHIDAKHEKPDLARKTVELIQEFGREALTVVGSAGAANTAIIRDMLSNYPTRSPTSVVPEGPRTPLTGKQAGGTTRPLTFACAKEVIKVYAMWIFGVLPFVPLDFDVLDIPLVTSPLKARFAQHRPILGAILSWLLTSPTMWRHLQRRGIRVYGFVLNSAAEFEEVKGWPIDGYMTDDPHLFREVSWLSKAATK